MQLIRCLAVSSVAVLFACSSTSRDEAGADAAITACPSDTAASITTDTSGATLATHVREHAASDDEIRMTAGVLAYLVVSTSEKEMSPWFVESRLLDTLTTTAARSHPGAWASCTADLPTRSGSFASCDAPSSCAPSLGALADCFDGALELAVGPLVEKIPLAKFKAWTGLMDESAKHAHAVGGDVLLAVKGALPPLEESRDLVERFAQLIAQAQLIAGAAAIVGVPDEPVLLVLGTLGTAVSAYKCARNIHAVAGFVDACLASNRDCGSPPAAGSTQHCEDVGGGGAVSQCGAGQRGLTCLDGSVPNGCAKSAGFGVNGGILCCDSQERP